MGRREDTPVAIDCIYVHPHTQLNVTIVCVSRPNACYDNHIQAGVTAVPAKAMWTFTLICSRAH